MTIYAYSDNCRRYEITIEAAEAVIYNTAQWIPAADLNNHQPSLIRTWNITDIMARGNGDEERLNKLIREYTIDAGYPFKERL